MLLHGPVRSSFCEEKAGYNRVTRENSEEVEMQLNPFEHHEQDYEEETDSPHGYMGEDLEEGTTRKEFRPCSHTMVFNF